MSIVLASGQMNLKQIREMVPAEEQPNAREFQSRENKELRLASPSSRNGVQNQPGILFSFKAGAKTINDEVLLLLQLCGDQGDLIHAKLQREKSIRLRVPPSPGRAFTADEKGAEVGRSAEAPESEPVARPGCGPQLRPTR